MSIPHEVQQPEEEMREHPDPDNHEGRALAELASFKHNPYREGQTGDVWYAWREGWLERKRFEEDRAVDDHHHSGRAPTSYKKGNHIYDPGSE